VQVISLLLVPPLQSYELDNVFGNPESVWNSVYYVVLLLLFTGALLLIIKFRMSWMIQVIMGIAILSTLAYVFFGLAVLLAPSLDPLIASGRQSRCRSPSPRCWCCTRSGTSSTRWA